MVPRLDRLIQAIPVGGKTGDLMTKKKTRRSISIKGITYQRLKNYCNAQDCSMSGYLEEIIAENLDAAGVPIPEFVEPYESDRNGKEDQEEIISQHFTF